MSTFPSSDLAQQVRSAFNELDLQQLAIFARHTPARRLAMVFELCDLARDLVIASERARAPDVTDDELTRRVRERIELAYGA